MGTGANIYLPDTLYVQLPVDPRTWVDSAAGVRGDELRAPLLERDAGSATAWHRQRPLFQGIATLAQSIPNNAFTAITGLSELIDNYAGHSDSTNTGRWYAPNTSSDGNLGGDWYLCTGYVPFNDNAAASVHIAGLRVNGGGTIQEGGRIPGGSGHAVDTMVVDLVQLSGGANDYVELVAYQNSGAATNTVASGKTPSLTVRWVAADPTWSGFAAPALPAVPHTWTGTDIVTGSSAGAGKVPLNAELRDAVRFLHNPPIARVTANGTSQTIPSGSGTWTSVNMTAAGETVDTYGGWSSGTPSRYVCQRAGLYFIAGFVNLIESGGTNNGYRATRLLVNGTTPYAGWTSIPQTSGNTGTGLYATGLIRMAAGDYVEVQAQQTHGSSLSLYSGSGNSSRIVAVWMAA